MMNNWEDKRRNKAQRADKLQTLKGHISLVSLYIIVAKFGDHVLHHLASSLSNVIRQADKNSSLGDFRI